MTQNFRPDLLFPANTRRSIRLTPAERTDRRVTAGYTADDVLCPFFKRFRPLKICCEGITDDSSLQISFVNRAALDRQAGIFCIDHWEKCELARMLNGKYEEK